MSNVAFKSGDYNEQKNIFDTISQDGLIFINPQNRTIVIGEENDSINFNSLMNNDNGQLSSLNHYTNSSKYLVDNKLLVDDNSTQYYSVDRATRVIGATDSNMTNGYITRKLSTLAYSIPYEATEFTYEIDYKRLSSSGWYQSTKEYTFMFPNNDIISSQIRNRYLIVFCYIFDNNNLDNNVSAYLYKTTDTDKINGYVKIKYTVTQDLIVEEEEFPQVYKAFWI